MEVSERMVPVHRFTLRMVTVFATIINPSLTTFVHSLHCRKVIDVAIGHDTGKNTSGVFWASASVGAKMMGGGGGGGGGMGRGEVRHRLVSVMTFLRRCRPL